MSLIFYKVLHIAGFIGVFMALGGAIFHTISGGTRESGWRKGAAWLHGIGMLFVLVAGFGMLARLGIHWPWPGWIWAKVVIWFFLGAALTLAYKKPGLAKVLWYGLPLVGVLAAYLALYKPF